MNKIQPKPARILLIIICLAIVTGVAIGAGAVVNVIKRNIAVSEIGKRFPEAVINPSGLRYIIQEPGNGPKPFKGRTVLVNYKGTLLNGTVFDNTDGQGRPLEFEAGVGNVIAGFDEAVLDMREGEKRLVIIPPELGYGKKKVGTVPGNNFIIFEMELFRIK